MRLSVPTAQRARVPTVDIPKIVVEDYDKKLARSIAKKESAVKDIDDLGKGYNHNTNCV